MNKIKVGIVGYGFVGGALKTWLEENNSANTEVLVSDPLNCWRRLDAPVSASC